MQWKCSQRNIAVPTVNIPKPRLFKSESANRVFKPYAYFYYIHTSNFLNTTNCMQYDKLEQSQYWNCNLRSRIGEMYLLSNSVDKAWFATSRVTSDCDVHFHFSPFLQSLLEELFNVRHATLFDFFFKLCHFDYFPFAEVAHVEQGKCSKWSCKCCGAEVTAVSVW